ncbi:HU family DNA-binding protein [Candidatus Kinetoplastidibacterium crithidiae]|uniref:Integration host factor subunit beta n=1 Tax=Candidatus Kinetoplastidibacterium crithidiae TCC036E TaxID=1208918 RepID=M1L4W2_9PROT|nr:HU family DNA-binding protein [Candidatus Kinetoplastibacterium crithidii]AFZ82631.1 integration host factor subunit beta [Candidatus Kinetoplastibacterium crithidii (ex Angomonas deanei ATCC 30255)]AGF47708.1 integration host factor subunit beta [Candidatus Kinetoplastibacterium crithidii TCC036E]
MTRLDLIDNLVSKYPDLSLKDVEHLVKTILSSLEDAMKLGKRIEVRGFGSFSIVTRHSRIARNPKSGSLVLLKERKVPIFKAGKELKDRIKLSK